LWLCFDKIKAIPGVAVNYIFEQITDRRKQNPVRNGRFFLPFEKFDLPQNKF